MTSATLDPQTVLSDRPQGQVLKGQYVGVWRSPKGKVKGLVLQAATATYSIKLPKYLRPMLVRELAQEIWIQVWAYPDAAIWRGINILPLPEAEALTLQKSIARHQAVASSGTEVESSVAPSLPTPQPLRVQVCTKGKCCKQGSQRLLQTLQAEIAAKPELAHIQLEATGCMKACKHGPNLRIAATGKHLRHVNVSSALALLSESA